MSSFYHSLISRHVLPTRSQWGLYMIHSVFILPALMIPFFFHFIPFIGRFLMLSVFPIMLLSGFWMTYLTRKKPHIVPISDIFTAYGFSYFVWGVELMYDIGYVTLHALALSFLAFSLFKLSATRTQLRLELSVLLSPLFLSHTQKIIYKTRPSSLVSFSIVSWTGSLFTLSHDRYWFFHDPLPQQQRILVQSLPLLVFVLTTLFGTNY